MVLVKGAKTWWLTGAIETLLLWPKDSGVLLPSIQECVTAKPMSCANSPSTRERSRAVSGSGAQQKSRFALGLVLGLIAVTSLTGCKKDTKQEKPTPAAPSTPEWKVDHELESSLAKLAQVCTSSIEKGALTCPGGERRKLVAELLASGTPIVSKLDTFISVLTLGEPPVRIVAANTLYDTTRAGFGKNLTTGATRKSQLNALLKLAETLPSPTARQLGPALAHTAALSGELALLFSVLEQKEALAAATYRYVMVHGRLGALEQVKKAVQHSNAAVRLSALEAPRNMQSWSEKDRAAICPWAQGLLKDTRPMVAERAASLLSRCGGAAVDQLLVHGEEAFEAGRFSRGSLAPYRDLCSGLRRRQGGGATEEQCTRNRNLLRAIAEADGKNEQLRALALSAIAYQWPDEDSVRLAESVAKKAMEGTLAESAGQTLERLRRRLAAEKLGREKKEAAVQ